VRSGGSGPVHAAERVPDHRPPVRRHRLCGREGLGVHDGQGVCARRDPGVCIHGQRGSAGREQAGRTRLRRRHGAGKRPPADRFVRVELVAGNLGFEHNDFFQEQAVKDAYKTWVSSIVLRNNTVTGVPYRDDPTIFAYNLINEPVCRDCPPYALQAWIQEMAAFVKGMDSAHLLTVGEEGYSSLTEDRRVYNPGSENNRWADTFGQDFMTDHSFDEIDFATMHAWVDNWKEEHLPELGLGFFVDWIEGHVEMADELGKPLILEEFGKTGRGVRDAYFKAAYDAVLDSVARSRSLVGALYWQFYVDGQRADWYPEDPERGPWGVTRADGPHVLTEELADSLME
jgi:endo-1,4-beta-mannosidase